MGFEPLPNLVGWESDRGPYSNVRNQLLVGVVVQGLGVDFEPRLEFLGGKEPMPRSNVGTRRCWRTQRRGIHSLKLFSRPRCENMLKIKTLKLLFVCDGQVSALVQCAKLSLGGTQQALQFYGVCQKCFLGSLEWPPKSDLAGPR